MTTHAPNFTRNRCFIPVHLSTRLLRLALGVSVGVVASLAAAADDSVWINDGIRSAIAQGKKEYVVPAGRFGLSNPIVIPDGTRNFTLRGAGKSATTFYGNNGIGYAVFAGVQTIMHNNWGVANLTNYTVSLAQEGETELELSSVANIKANDYLAIWDDSYVKHRANGDKQRNHAGILKVVAVNPTTKTITIDRPLARSFDVNPRVALVDGRIVAGLTIKDMGFDGSVQVGNTVAFNNGIVSLGVSDNTVLKNLDVKRYSTRALTMNWARDVLVDGVTMRDGYKPELPGYAYGITVCRSQNVRVQNCASNNSRHSFIATNGSSDVTYQDCKAEGPNGNFDTHGFDERRISYIRCYGSGSLNLGNEAYLGGGRDFLIQDSFFGYTIMLNPNVTKVRAFNSKFFGVQVVSRANTNGFPASGMSDDIAFADCYFYFTRGMYSEDSDFGKMSFDRCVFETTNDPYALVMNGVKATGSVSFDSCSLLLRNGGNYVPITLSNTSPSFSLTMKNCSIYSEGNTWSTVVFGPKFGGKSVLTGNTLYTDLPKASFFQNLSTKSIVSMGNMVRKKSFGSSLIGASAGGARP